MKALRVNIDIHDSCVNSRYNGYVISLSDFNIDSVILVGISKDITPEQFWQWIGYTSCSFWLLFDPLINLFRGKKLFYRGENSFIDGIGRKYPVLYFMFKAIALGLLIISINTI